MTKSKFAALSFTALMVYAIVLRPPLAVVGPLLREIATGLSINLGQQALLTSIPVFCFGVGAFAGPAMVRRLGLDRTMLLLVIALSIALMFRNSFGYSFLLIGTALAGLAIAIANVVMPSVVREKFPTRISLVTALYTTVMAFTASFASSVAVPLSQSLGGWRNSMSVWIYPALIAVLLWWVQMLRGPQLNETHQVAEHHEWSTVLRHRVTWALFAFFGIQSLGFYTILSWLPSILTEYGYNSADAGNALGLTTVVGVPVALALSSNFSKFGNLGWLGFGISLVTATGFAMLAIVPSSPLIGCVLIGLGMACTFPLSLNLISTRASTAHQTTQLSAISQGFGYLLSGLGTFMFGQLRDFTGGWIVPLVLMASLTLVQAASATIAGGKSHIPVSR